MEKKKKNEFISTIGFNRNDPDHCLAVSILNSMSRGKADYITKAVLFYEEYGNNMQSRQQQDGIDYGKIKDYVIQVIKEYETDGTSNKADGREKDMQEPVSEIEKPEAVKEPSGISEEAMGGILKSLQSFRH